MKTALIDFLIRLLLTAIDKWLDGEIQKQGWPKATEDRAHVLRAKLVPILAPYLGDLAGAFAAPLVKRALKRAFPNDPSTGNWA